jgi:hypothetical protein
MSALPTISLVLCALLAVLLLILAIKALTGDPGSPPPEWLVSWTAWLVSALGVVFAPLALASVAKALHALAERWSQTGARDSGAQSTPSARTHV